MKKMGRLLFAAVLLLPILGTACAQRRVVYAWGPGEQPYYQRWEVETHRQHEDWDRRSKAEQKEYWNWRKNHHD